MLPVFAPCVSIHADSRARRLGVLVLKCVRSLRDNCISGTSGTALAEVLPSLAVLRELLYVNAYCPSFLL